MSAQRHRAFTSEWIYKFAVVSFYIGAYEPILKRASGWSHPVVVGLLVGLSIALFLLCGLIEERDPQRAWRLSNIFFAIPAVGLGMLVLLFVRMVLWRRLV